MRTGGSMYSPPPPHTVSSQCIAPKERQVCRLMLVWNLLRFVRFDSVPLYASQQTSRSLFLCLHHFLFLGLSLPLCKITHTMLLIAVTAKKKKEITLMFPPTWIPSPLIVSLSYLFWRCYFGERDCVRTGTGWSWVSTVFRQSLFSLLI